MPRENSPYYEPEAPSLAIEGEECDYCNNPAFAMLDDGFLVCAVCYDALCPRCGG